MASPRTLQSSRSVRYSDDPARGYRTFPEGALRRARFSARAGACARGRSGNRRDCGSAAPRTLVLQTLTAKKPPPCRWHASAAVCGSSWRAAASRGACCAGGRVRTVIRRRNWADPPSPPDCPSAHRSTAGLPPPIAVARRRIFDLRNRFPRRAGARRLAAWPASASGVRSGVAGADLATRSESRGGRRRRGVAAADTVGGASGDEALFGVSRITSDGSVDCVVGTVEGTGATEAAADAGSARPPAPSRCARPAN